MAALAVGLGITYVATATEDQSAPTRLEFDALTPTSTKLSWRSTGADEYVIKVGADRTLTSSTATKVPGTKSSITLSDLPATTPGSDQYFRVDAVEDGEVVSSRTARFILRPGAMSTVTVPRVATNGMRVGWDKVDNARQYDVVVATDENFTDRVVAARTVQAVDAFASRGLEPDTRYWVRVRPVNNELVGAWGEPASFKTGVPSVSFKVATWNVCSEKCDGYAGRARIMADYLNANEVDIFALQESGGVRVGKTTNAIFSGGTREFTRASGGAKARYIFYRPALFDQLGGGFFPVGDGRHATWAQFRVKKSGRTFFYVNVHLENGHGNDARRARETTVMINRMAALNPDGQPIVYAGDFNSGRHRGSDSPGTMMRQAGMNNTREAAAEPINADVNTGHTLGTKILRSGAAVDHVFASKQFQVLGWEQLVRASGSAYTRPVVSDHNAVTSVLALDSKETAIGDLTPTVPVPELDTVTTATPSPTPAASTTP